MKLFISKRWWNALRGWAAWAVVFVLFFFSRNPKIVTSLQQTVEVISREWKKLPEVSISLPDTLGIDVGTLFSCYFPDGTDAVIGEVSHVDPADSGFVVFLRLLPEAETTLFRDSLIEVVYPPRTNMEAASLVFDGAFQANLAERVRSRAAALLEEHIQPRAYELLADVFQQVRPSDESIDVFISHDLYPELKKSFDVELTALKDKLLADLDRDLSGWDKAGIGWDLIFGDAADVEAVLTPIAQASLEEFLAGNKDKLLGDLFSLWPLYKGRAKTWFEDVARPILYRGVLIPLYEENKQRLLDHSLDELKWAYAETILARDQSFDRQFVYTARHLVLRRREARIFVRQGEGLRYVSGQSFPVRLYFRPRSPLFSIEPASGRGRR